MISRVKKTICTLLACVTALLLGAENLCGLQSK